MLLSVDFVDTTALSIAFGNQGQKLPLVSFITVFVHHAAVLTACSVIDMARVKATVEDDEGSRLDLGMSLTIHRFFLNVTLFRTVLLL